MEQPIVWDAICIHTLYRQFQTRVAGAVATLSWWDEEEYNYICRTHVALNHIYSNWDISCILFRASVILLVSLTCRGDCLAFANEKTSKQDHTNYVVYRSWWPTTIGLPYVCNGCILSSYRLLLLVDHSKPSLSTQHTAGQAIHTKEPHAMEGLGERDIGLGCSWLWFSQAEV